MTTERILEIFKEILTIPRKSGHEELIIAYRQNWAKEHNLECKTDEAGNVLLKLGEEELSICSFGYGCVFVKYFVSGIHKSGF